MKGVFRITVCTAIIAPFGYIDPSHVWPMHRTIDCILHYFNDFGYFYHLNYEIDILFYTIKYQIFSIAITF